MKQREKHAAVVLAAGKGNRMNTSVKKQYLHIGNKPVLYYSLCVFEACPFIEEIILVTGKDEIEYCRDEIVNKFDIKKVSKIVAGGKERYHSVYEGLKALTECSYVYIHDGARPFIDQEILLRTNEEVRKYGACVVGMPVKDTIKICDSEGFTDSTPSRDRVWMIQTPQVFKYSLIKSAHSKIMEAEEVSVTDDAMVLETITGKKAKLVPGSYENIKITTPEDLDIAENFAKKRKNLIDI